MLDHYGSSVRRAYSVVMLSTSMYYYRPADRHEQLLRMRMRKIAGTRVRYGFLRIYILLRREGFADHHKRVYRLYKDKGMDFASDALFDGRRFRVLAVVDDYSKKSLSLRVGQSLKGQDVQETLNNICLS